jgi:neutral ceramidase
MGLSLHVSELLNREEDPRYHLGAEQILLCATHTHNSQAGFSTSEAYNSLASPISGYDAKMFNFLSKNVSQAIKESIDQRMAAIGAISITNIEGLVRNRSIDAFEKIEIETQETIKSSVKNGHSYFQNPDLPAFIKKKEEFEALDPYVRTIIFRPEENQTPSPIAVINFLSVHPTVMGHDTEVYSPDLFGVVERIIKEKTGFYNTVISFINGTEGDISPNWEKQDIRNILNLGHSISEKIIEGFRTSKHLFGMDNEININYDIITIKGAPVNIPLRGNVPSCFHQITSKTAISPYPGIATIGGAEDGRTLQYAQGMYEGLTSTTCVDGQGNKINAINQAIDLTFGPLPRILKGVIASSFKSLINGTAPDKIPLGIYSIGNFTIASVPGEPTTALGYYITTAVKKSHQKYQDHTIVIASLANEYLSYFTTPAEYAVQHYEGASTMYGVHAGSLLEQELALLASGNSRTILPEEIKTKPGKNKNIHQPQIFKPQWNIFEGLANFFVDLNSGQPKNNFPIFQYETKKNDSNEWYESAYPSVTIQKLNRIKNVFIDFENDKKGLGLVTVLIEDLKENRKWQSLWYPFSAYSSGVYRFKIISDQSNPLFSKPFNLSDLTKGTIMKQ